MSPTSDSEFCGPAPEKLEEHVLMACAEGMCGSSKYGMEVRAVGLEEVRRSLLPLHPADGRLSVRSRSSAIPAGAPEGSYLLTKIC